MEFEKQPDLTELMTQIRIFFTIYLFFTYL